MGVFSEMSMDGNTERKDEVTPFTLEPQVTESAEIFGDEAAQQAEAQAAPAALEYLKQQDEDKPEDEDEEEPAEAPLTPAQKKQAHEEAEAKRKAEWEAKHQEKEEAELMAWETAVAMDDNAVAAAALGRVAADAERITRRNMKMCVAESIQTKCLESPAFARQTMHPRKNMLNCLKYINCKAREYAEQEMKDNDVKPENGIYGTDVPDGLCYQWAEDYFNDMDAEEDKDKDDKFVPKPYAGPSTKSRKAPAKKSEKKSAPKKEEKNTDDGGQLSLDTTAPQEVA